MQALNLPKTDLKLVIRDNRTQVYDILRRKYVALTPEEWVRQHFIHFLVSTKGYNAAQMANEVTVELNGMRKRCDSVVYDSSATPVMVIEYKAPHVAITQQVFDQICRYNSQLRVPWLIVSNGLQHYCCRIDYENGSYHFVPDIPTWDCL